MFLHSSGQQSTLLRKSKRNMNIIKNSKPTQKKLKKLKKIRGTADLIPPLFILVGKTYPNFPLPASRFPPLSPKTKKRKKILPPFPPTNPSRGFYTLPLLSPKTHKPHPQKTPKNPQETPPIHLHLHLPRVKKKAGTPLGEVCGEKSKKVGGWGNTE